MIICSGRAGETFKRKRTIAATEMDKVLAFVFLISIGFRKKSVPIILALFFDGGLGSNPTFSDTNELAQISQGVGKGHDSFQRFEYKRLTMYSLDVVRNGALRASPDVLRRRIKSNFKEHLQLFSGSIRYVDALLTGIIRTGNIPVYFRGTGSTPMGWGNGIVLKSRIKIEREDFLYYACL